MRGSGNSIPLASVPTRRARSTSYRAPGFATAISSALLPIAGGADQVSRRTSAVSRVAGRHPKEVGSKWSGVVYSWRSRRKPRIGPLSHDGFASCSRVPPRILGNPSRHNAYSRCPQRCARCRIEPRPASRVAGPHLSCGHIMAGAGSSARASAIPRLSTTAPRAGLAAYVRDPRATVTDHGCSRGSPGFPLHIFMDAIGRRELGADAQVVRTQPMQQQSAAHMCAALSLLPE